MTTRSPKTRPTAGQPWPRNAAEQRMDIRIAADTGRELIKAAWAASENNHPGLVRTYLAQMEVLFADIQRLTTEARVGPEPKRTEEDA